MANPPSFAAYERFLDSTLATWPAVQRAVLAAAMAQRWLPVYEAFSKAEGWGDAKGLGRVLDAVWQHLQAGRGGESLAATRELGRCAQMVEDNTPYADDFGDLAPDGSVSLGPAALAFCVMLGEAVQCCTTVDNLGMTVQALISGFEAVAPEWETEEPDSRRWRRGVVQRELKKQLKLIEQIGALAEIDEASLQSLRKALNGKAFAAETAPPVKAAAPPRDAAGRTFISNQTAFEQYRRMMESDLKSSDEWWQKEYAPGSANWALMIIAAWGARYSRRRQTLDGTYGPLADEAAAQALVARQRALDGAQTAILDWDSDVLEILDLSLRNPHGGFEVTSIEQPHAYGPSLRALWAAAQRLGLPTLEAWNYILAWARHHPAAWATEDQRKKRRLAYTTPALNDHLTRALNWQPTGDPEHPWAANFDAAPWRIRLNDFPDAFMYTLLIEDTPVGDFNDWPQSWTRE